MSLGTILVVAGIVVALLLVLNRQAVVNFLTAGRAQVGAAGRAALNADPVAVFQQQAEDASHQLGEQIKSLEKATGVTKLLQNQVSGDEKEAARLEGRIKQVLANGDPNKQAENYALQLARLREHLSKNQEQLAAQQESTKQLAKGIDLNRRKVQDLGERVRQKGQQLAMTEAMKNANAAFTKFTNTDLFSGLKSTEDEIDRRIAENEAAVEVGQHMSADALGAMQDDEDARKAEAQEILAGFQPKVEEKPAAPASA